MNVLPALPVAVPLLIAAVLVAAAPVRRRWIIDLVTIAAAAATTVLLFWLLFEAGRAPIVYWFGNCSPRRGIPIGVAFAIDAPGAALASFAGLLTTATLVYAWKYFESVKTFFHALMLIVLAGMAGFCLTGDLFNLFVFFELMGVVAYALTAHKVEEASDRRLDQFRGHQQCRVICPIAGHRVGLRPHWSAQFRGGSANAHSPPR